MTASSARFALLVFFNLAAFDGEIEGGDGEFFARFGRNLKNLAKKRLPRGVAATQTAYNR